MTNGIDAVLADQIDYDAAVAAEYDSHSVQAPVGEELAEAVEPFRPAGKVLELACGRGRWTAELLHYATEVTAVEPLPRCWRLLPSTSASTHASGSSTPTSSTGAIQLASMSCSSRSCSPTWLKRALTRSVARSGHPGASYS